MELSTKVKAALAGLMFLIIAGECAAESIRLRASATVEAGQAIRIADVAQVDGERAKKASEIVLIEDVESAMRAKGWCEIELRQVREAIHDAGMSSGQIAISGSQCVVRIGRCESDLRGEELAQPQTTGMSDQDQPTIGETVRAILIERFGVDVESIRLAFDPRDDDLLRQAVGERRLVLGPLSSTNSTRAILQLNLIEDERIVEDRTLRVDLQLRNRVLVARSLIGRGQTIDSAMFEVRDEWISPGDSGPVLNLDDVNGTKLRRRILAGQILKADDLEPAVLVHRGELVTIHCLNRGVAVQMLGRARSDGRAGEVVEFRIDGSKESFMARVDGRGRAVIDMDQRTSVAMSDEKERD